MVDACIIGAPKCGTSSLFQWLTAHPQISGPEAGKELFFFMDDGHPLTKEPNIHTASLDTYSSLFPDSESGCAVEATTHYLFQDTARKNLAAMESKPLAIALLRDPAERVWSSFQYTRNNFAHIDPSLSFTQYVEWVLHGEAERVTDYIDHAGSAYVLARDVEYSAYVKHLRPWREAVGKDRLIVLNFDTLATSPEDMCLRIAAELGVDESFYDDFDFRACNATYRPLSHSLQSLARSINRRMPEGLAKDVAKYAYKTLCTSSALAEKTEKDRRALEQLRKYYGPYNERLSDEFDVSVAEWMTTEGQ